MLTTWLPLTVSSMWGVLVLVILNTVLIPTSKCEEIGAEYLKSVMSKLQSERLEPSALWNNIEDDTAYSTPERHDTAGKIMGPTPLPVIETELEQSPAEHPKEKLPPPQPLSKEELTAFYQAAVNKGAILDLASMTSGSVQGMQALENLFGSLNVNKDHAQEDQGYYYYFYPIKSFDTESTKTNEFGNLRSRGISALKHAPDELTTLTKLILDGINGKDCTERIACEVGRAVRKMRLDKKPMRVLEILLPPSLSKQLQRIRKAAAKKEKCNFIPCKRKGAREL
ncbi:uncharacterized protein LOC110831262 isoform X4 [Zootermopsis nevadensis]|uniref:uncharacterized protein LOC110831262 isoform X4 n=1 Tax=Zootermopsis nevadensis TaxID=136037 RepID=UPI000B8EAAFE|nr:uncharacterized protein LOC110831262 isoform X4 [Zootermopsis nevadensis]